MSISAKPYLIAAGAVGVTVLIALVAVQSLRLEMAKQETVSVGNELKSKTEEADALKTAAKKDAQLLDLLQKQSAAMQAELDSAGKAAADVQTNLTGAISHDETTKSWADTAVPDGVVRVLNGADR